MSKRLLKLLLVLLLCLAAWPGLQTVGIAQGDALLTFLQSELLRNAQVLQKEPAPAYFVSYTVHDERATRIVASFGALQRSDDGRSRIASVQVRVGDYLVDNTHPIRGEFGQSPSGLMRIALPLTNDERPIRLALWRATDRAFKQASQALTRVKTNIASKVKEEDPSPDFSREDPQVYVSKPAEYSLDTKLWEARLRRVSAAFAEDPLVFRSDVSL